MMDTPSTKAKGDAFETLVADHYRQLGYGVQRNVPIGGQQVDILATLHSPDGQSLAVIIECKYAEDRLAGNDAVHDILGAYLSAKTANLAQACAIVTNRGFSLEAQRAAATHRIHLITENQLAAMTHRVPLAYAMPLGIAYEKAYDGVPCFLAGRARMLRGSTNIPDIGAWLYDCAATPGVTIVFGSVGTGKTTQLITHAHHLTAEFLAGNAIPVAIYVPLERFRPHRQGPYFDEFLVNYLRSQYRMRELSWAEITHWLVSHTAVLLLDGFDEIPQLNTEVAIREEFEHITTTLPAGCSAVLSCRTTLAARSHGDMVTLMTEQLLKTGHTPALLELDLFTPADVIRYVNTVGAPKRLLQGTIAKTLLRRPLLLRTTVDLIAGGMSARGVLDDAAALLDRCVTFLIEHRADLRQAGIGPAQWRTFLEEAALRMMLEEERQIDAQRLAELLQAYFPTRVDAEYLRRLEFDASVRTVFDFDVKTGLRWSHSIFRDYLAASAIARRLIVPQPADRALDGHLLTAEQVDFLQYAVRKRQRDWKGLTEFRRPSAPPAISPQNGWQWISPGLSVINEMPTGDLRLVFFPKGYWFAEQPVTVEDLEYIGTAALRDQTRYKRLKLPSKAPITLVTHDEAERLATSRGARLPSDMEWERAARWIDGSYPTTDVIPHADVRRPTPPYVTAVPANPWGVRNAVGCVWQWTSSYDAGAQRYLCRGSWWGATNDEKRYPTKRLTPREPDHTRTGVRLIMDATGGEI